MKKIIFGVSALIIFACATVLASGNNNKKATQSNCCCADGKCTNCNDCSACVCGK